MLKANLLKFVYNQMINSHFLKNEVKKVKLSRKIYYRKNRIKGNTTLYEETIILNVKFTEIF